MMTTVYGVFNDEKENVSIVTYQFQKRNEDKLAFMKIVMRKNESLQLFVANVDAIPATAMEVYLQTAGLTEYDEAHTEPFVSFSEYDECVKDGFDYLRLIENAFFQQERFVENDGLYGLNDLIDARIQKEWGSFRLIELIWLIAFPKLAYFGFNINIRGLNREAILKISAAPSKKDVWKVFYPNLGKKAINVLEKNMPRLKDDMTEEEVEEALYGNGMNDFYGAVFNIFDNVDRLTTFINKLDEIGFEKFKGGIRFMDKTIIHNPNQATIRIDLDGEAMKARLLPFFSNSQERIEFALINSLKRVEADNEAFIDGADFLEYDDVMQYGGVSALASLDDTLTDTFEMIMRIERMDISEVERGEEIKERFYNRKYKTIHELHDAASSTFLYLSPNEYIEFDYSDEDKQLADEIDGFVFELPKTSVDLRLVGEIMHHCVGSYDELIQAGQTKIVAIQKDDDYILCLEIEDSKVVQCKKKYNALLTNSDEAVNAALFAYLKKKSLIVDTKDLAYVQSKYQ